jgi:glutamine synthetase
MYGDVKDPITKQRYERDPRWIAQKAELYLKNSGVADTSYFGAEAEFFIFDNISFDQNQHSGYYYIDAEEGRWNSGRRENNLGYRPRYKEGYFPVPPTDHYQDLRSEMVRPRHRVPSPRSRHRRAVRDRSEVQHAREERGQHDAVQVHHPQRSQPVG